ncbi:hypothetical protein BDQ17DRAFT_1241529 [Cyathus striatus]|nr:hypothetical protein BDQ17DRAFT_1241529 [Cyathus striatus]
MLQEPWISSAVSLSTDPIISTCHLPGYKFTYDDYVSYIEIHKAFLNSPRGHAALLMGGIVR